MTDIDVEPAAPRNMPLGGWKGVAQAAAMVLITVGAGAGIPAAFAVATVLLYRIVTFKIVITLATLAYYRLRAHRVPAQS